MCTEGCTGRAFQLGFPMLKAADFALRQGPITWGETLLLSHLPDWGCLYLLVKGRLQDPAQAPELLQLTLAEVNELTSRLLVAMESPAIGTGKPPHLSSEDMLRQVFPDERIP